MERSDSADEACVDATFVLYQFFRSRDIGLISGLHGIAHGGEGP